MATIFNSIAKLYLTWVLCALPANKETKRPILSSWKSYQDTLPTESEWDVWGTTATGICIITGKISGYLLVIDFDDKGSRYEAWCQLIPQELCDRLTVIVQTPSGGYHVYLRYDGELIGNIKLAFKKNGIDDNDKPKYITLIETRGEGGLVIAPPTPGYEIIAGSFDSIPVFSKEDVDKLLEAARSFCEKQTGDTDSVTPLDSLSKTWDVTSPVLGVHDAEYRIARAIAYIAKMPPAVSGENGHAAALKVANVLYEFGLTKYEAFRVFMEYYNRRCLPPWSDNEIWHKIDEAFKKPLNEHGSKLLESAQKSKSKSTAPMVLPTSAKSNISVVKARLKITIAADIEDREIDWLLYNRIALGDISLLAGKGGIGKTFITTWLASLITNGYSFDGHNVPQGSCLFMEGEGRASTFRKRLCGNGANLNLVGVLEGKEIWDTELEEWVLDPIVFQDIDIIDRAITEFEERTGCPIRVLCFDPIGNFTGGVKTGTDSDVRSFMTPLQRLAERRNIAVILVAHTRKAVTAAAQDSVLDSVAYVNAARAVWVLYLDKADKDLRYFAPAKANDCIDPKAFSYRIVRPHGEIQIVETDIDKHADDFMEEQSKGMGRPAKELPAAIPWLQCILADGAKSASEIFEQGKATGFTKSTIRRALEEVGAKQEGGHKGSPSMWSLPPVSDNQNAD